MENNNYSYEEYFFTRLVSLLRRSAELTYETIYPSLLKLDIKTSFIFYLHNL